MKWYVGTSGWNYDHWKERFYPAEVAKKRWLQYYAGRFNTVEVNATFYRWLPATTFQKWYDSVPEGFVFTLKAPRVITHIKKLKDVEQYVRDFYALTAHLAEKRGAHLFQLPPSMKCTQPNMQKLDTFCALLDKREHNVIEFRDSSWWDTAVYEILRKHGVAFCSVSGLEMPDHIAATSGTCYLRFHGDHYGQSYTDKTLKRYATELKKLGCTHGYIYFNNDIGAHAPHDALRLRRMLTDA